MKPRPPISSRTDTLLPYTTRFRSTMVRAENRRFPGCLAGAAGEAVDLDRGDPALHMEQAHRRWRRVEPGGLHRLGAGQRDELVDVVHVIVAALFQALGDRKSVV